LASVGIKSNPAVVAQIVNACKGKKPEEVIRKNKIFS
jgi:ribosomal protein L12E/L44/L45/RPP1/RPP2